MQHTRQFGQLVGAQVMSIPERHLIVKSGRFMVWIGKFRSFKLMSLVLLNKLMKSRFIRQNVLVLFQFTGCFFQLGNLRLGWTSFQCPIEGYLKVDG